MDLLTSPKTRPSKTEREAAVRASYWLPTQQRWIESKARKKLLVKTRRFGGSWAEAYAVARNTAREGNTYDAWYGSRDMLAARLAINDIKAWCRVLKIAAEDRGEILLPDPKKDFGAFQVHVAGHDITSLSSHPDAFAGKQGRFTLDEAALHRDLRLLYSIAQPAIMRGGSMSLISTQRGRLNFFNALVDEIKHKGNPKKFELFEIDIIQAVAEGLWIKIRDALPAEDERKNWTEDEFLQSLRDECADEEAWKQEYMCQPSDDADALLSWEDIIACTMHDVDRVALNALGPHSTNNRYVGYDVARKKHLAVIWQWVEVNGILLPERVEVMQNWKFSAQEQRLYEMIDDVRVKAVRIDATGLGMQIAERAETRHPQKCQGVMLSAGVKLDLAVQMQQRFQDRTLRVDDDRATQYDFFSVKKHISASNNILLRSEAGETDGHADRFWAAALGIEAAMNAETPGFFQRLKRFVTGTDDGNSRRSARLNRSAE